MKGQTKASGCETGFDDPGVPVEQESHYSMNREGSGPGPYYRIDKSDSISELGRGPSASNVSTLKGKTIALEVLICLPLS